MSFKRSRYDVASSKIFNYALHGVRIGCQALDLGFQSVIKLHAQLTYYVLPIMAQLIYWDISGHQIKTPIGIFIRSSKRYRIMTLEILTVVDKGKEHSLCI